MFSHNPKRIALTIAGLALVLLSLTGCTTNNRYSATPIKDGVKYSPVDTPEDSKDPDSARNNVECFTVRHEWSNGWSGDGVDLDGTYCKVEGDG